MADDRKVYRCHCGSYHYLDVTVYEEDEPGWDLLSIAITEEPNTFWERLACLLKRQPIWHEVSLDKKAARELAVQLQEVLQK